MLQPGEIIGDTYQLERPLGAGGMGEVWLARHTLLEEYRAIKIMKSEVGLSPQLRERFVKGEARNSLRLERHPNIVRVYDLNQHQGMPYIVMEFVEGSSLRQLMTDHKLFSPHQVGQYLEQLAMALEVAHRQGMVHRDIKPANVLVDRQGVLKLTDFGLTKDLHLGHDDNLTMTGQYLGTPAYMSPEQATGHADQRSDIYSLAAMIFEMLAGRPPFVGTATSIIVQHATATPPSLREFNPNVPASVEPVLVKALAKHPEDRYRTALEFSRAYNAALDVLGDQRNGTTVAIEERPGISTELAVPHSKRAVLVPATPDSLIPVQPGVTGSGTISGGKNNTPLIILASVLATLIVVLSGVLVLLLANNSPKTEPTKVAENAATATTAVTAVVNSTTVPATTTIPPTVAPTTAPPTTTAPTTTTPPATTAAPTVAPATSTPSSDPLITAPPITAEPLIVATTAAVPLITTLPPQPGGQGGATFTARGKLLFTFTQKGSKPGFKRYYLSNGREETVAAADTNVAEAAWTADGGSFVYVNSNERSINQVVGTSITRLATGVNPSFSPDGQKLVYIGGDGQIVVASADGSNGTKITSQVSEKIGPRFSPDNSKIAFSQKINGQWQVWVMDADGGNLTQVTNQSENPRWPAWSPDGTRLTFNTLDGAGNPKDIWVIDLSGQNGHTVATGGQNGRPFWSADDYIFFNSDRDKTPGQEDIYAVRPDGTGLVRVTHSSADYDYYNPVWHPNN